GMVGDAQKHPSFEHALEFFAASLQSLGISPNAGNGRYFAIERTIVLDDFVPGLAHGGPDVRSEHNPDYLTTACRKAPVVPRQLSAPLTSPPRSDASRTSLSF